VQPDIANVEVPDWIASGSGLVLFISLFLPWVHIKVGVAGFNQSGNAGASFGWISIISFLAVLTILTLTILDVELPFPSGLVYLGAGALSVLMTVLVMLVRPFGGLGGLGITGVNVSKIPWYGAFIGLIAGIGILVGGFMKWNEQRY
jgi:hypothetical protein